MKTTALRELVEALDRRIPQVERAGELRIAREAAAPRKEAMTRLEELKGAASDRHTRDITLGEAVMTDDGGPALGEDVLSER